MDVSVLIATRDTRDLTCAAIRSVLESEGGLNREVIVVDNGSRDDTAAVLARDYPAVTCFRAEQNLGFAAACNRAARAARGEFLLLFNSDARLEPAALQEAVRWMRANPHCAVAGAQLLNENGSRQNAIANFPCLATELLNKSLLRWLMPARFPGKERIAAGPMEVESVVGAFFLTPRRVWEALGGLDERFFFFLEETDYCLRAKQSGKAVVHLPQVRVLHGQGKSARRHAAGARIEYWRSRYRYFQKHHPWRVRAALASGLLLRLLADFAASSVLTGLSFGRSARWRGKWAVHRALLAWHLRGCPSDRGLPR